MRKSGGRATALQRKSGAPLLGGFGMLPRMKRTFLIDTDTASDDAVALIMELRSPEVEVVGITTVAGNVEVRQASRNALYTAELCGSSVPVFTGGEKPRKRAPWRGAVLRGECDAGGGVQHLVRSGSGANGGEKRDAGGDGGLAFVPRGSGAEFEGDRVGFELWGAGSSICDREIG